MLTKQQQSEFASLFDAMDSKYSALNDVTHILEPKPHQYHSFAGRIESPSLKLFIGRSPVKEALVRILIAMDRLTDTAFDLPQRKLAAQIGCSIKFISKSLKQLSEMELLKCVNTSYVVGESAKTYRAKGALRIAILAAMKARKTKKPLPTQIKTGTYNQTIFEAALHFINDVSPTAFLNWAYTIPGFADKKDREQKVVEAYYRRRAYYKISNRKVA